MNMELQSVGSQYEFSGLVNLSLNMGSHTVHLSLADFGSSLKYVCHDPSAVSVFTMQHTNDSPVLAV